MTKATHDNLEAILRNPSSIKSIDEPSQDMVDLAVSLNPDLIKDIKDSTLNERNEALKRDPNSIRHFIDDATPEEKMLALELDPLVIKHFPNPTEDEQVFAVDKNEKSFEFIDEKVLKQRASAVYVAKYHKIGFIPF